MISSGGRRSVPCSDFWSSSLLLILQQLELVARVLLLVVEHDPPPRVDGHQLQQVILHAAHHLEGLLGLIKADDQLGGLLEELDRHLLAQVLLHLLPSSSRP